MGITSAKALGAAGIRLSLSALFFFTAIAKMLPVEPFEFSIVESGLAGWELASVIARLLIGIELALATLLLLGSRIQLTLRAGVVFLGLLSIYLLYLLITKGEGADCGCLGKMGRVPPLASLGKNVLMMGLLLLAGKWGGGPRFPFHPTTLFWNITVIALSLPFVLERPEALFRADKGQRTAEFPTQRFEESKAAEKLAFPLDSGKRILAFMSTSCPHCQRATRKLAIIEERLDLELPIHFFLSGNAEERKAFWEKSRSTPYPNSPIELEELWRFAKKKVPAVYLLEGGESKARMGFKGIREERIRKFLKEGRINGSDRAQRTP